MAPSLSVPTAVDVYPTRTVEREWSSERVERWWGAALARELLN